MLAYSALQNGDRLIQPEFHRLYEAAPDGFHAELIGGIVHLPLPVKVSHGTCHASLIGAAFIYSAQTPGVEGGSRTTVILAGDSQVQPDIHLRILPEHGGQSNVSADDYLVGPPELVIEVSDSRRAIDLHRKKEDYRRHGVPEYLVACPREGEFRWFDLADDRELPLAVDGVLRSFTFPGLWIDTHALWRRDDQLLLATAQRGVETAEHAEFVHDLARRRASRS